MRRWVDFAALLSVGVTVVILVVVVPNRAKTARLRAQRDKVQERVEDVKADVDRLAREIEALQNDPWFVERRLRSEYRYLRPGEQLLEAPAELPKPSRDDAPSTPAASAETTPRAG